VKLNYPNTFIGNEFEGLERFSRKNDNQIIVKSASGIRSKVIPFAYDSSIEKDFGKQFPHQFQEKLEGYNVRAHVVGDTVLSCIGKTDYLDYRYAREYDHELIFEKYSLPEWLERECVRLTRVLGLEFSGIDLFITTEGEWYCFEVNPSPGYTWFEENSGLPITKTIVDKLLNV
jgi:predicted ATP-grasp superfamily ATP-dependent carboligase